MESSIPQEEWSVGLKTNRPKAGVLIISDVIHRKNFIQLLPNIVSVENFHTHNLPADDVENKHPFFWHQTHVPVTGTETAFWFGLRVEGSANVVSAAATVENGQGGNLGSQFVFAMLFEKLAKFG